MLRIDDGASGRGASHQGFWARLVSDLRLHAPRSVNTVVPVRGDVTLEDLAADPHPHLARLRARAPVAWVPAVGGFLVTGRAAALDVLRDPETFTVADPRFSTARVVGPSMLSLDHAEHDRHRTPFAAAFRPREVAVRFGGFIREQVHRRLATITDPAHGPTAELRGKLAAPLAASVVAQSLGLEGSDEAIVTRLVGWYRDIVASVSGIAAGAEPTAAGAEAMDALGGHLLAHVADVAVETLSAEEAISNAAVIMFGGIETTEGLILNVLWHLLTNPAALEEVSAQPDLASAAVEESLRLEPAATRVDRYATRATRVAGTEIDAGDLVVVSLAGANRDPAEFPDPDRFDLHRPNGRRHLAFAAGPHVCIGMDLARLEAREAVIGVVTLLPGIRLADDAVPPTGLVFRKPDRLPVRWT
jgi:cytochrome P450